LMHPRIPLAFLAARAHCWLMVTLSSTRTPRSLSAELLPAGPPQPVLVPGVVPPQVQDPALALVEPHHVPLCPAFQPIQVHSVALGHRSRPPFGTSQLLGDRRLAAVPGQGGQGSAAAAGSEQRLEHGHPSPGLAGPAQPRLTHRQEGGHRAPGSAWPTPPSPAAAVTHFQSQRGRRRRRGGGGFLLPCLILSTQGIPTGSRNARSRGDGSAPGACGIGILVGRIPARSRPEPRSHVQRTQRSGSRWPERPEPARFAPDRGRTRLGVALDASGCVAGATPSRSHL